METTEQQFDNLYFSLNNEINLIEKPLQNLIEKEKTHIVINSKCIFFWNDKLTFNTDQEYEVNLRKFISENINRIKEKEKNNYYHITQDVYSPTMPYKKTCMALFKQTLARFNTRENQKKQLTLITLEIE